MATVEFPPAALTWLTADSTGDALVVAASIGVPRLLARSDRKVVAVAKDVPRAARLKGVPGISPVVARPESLPFGSYHFGLVLIHQMFDQFAPGLALPELARVLRPDGYIATSYFCRDDSVPWVRRLAELLRGIDEDAMPEDTRATAIAPLLASKYFTKRVSRDFRVWVPISRQGMLDMVAGQGSIANLEHDDRIRVLEKVAAIYDGAASASELRLPYQLRCWRAQVDHAELTQPVRLRDDGLAITF